MLKTHVLAAVMLVFGGASWAGSHATDTTAAADTDASAPAETVDLEAAERIFRKSCRACHGNKAQGAASYPELADKTPEYIAEKLEIYRSGEKIGPNSILMISHAKKLSDEDIANISVYVATAFD
ncbi:c-type cytochrome [uncultured Roseobacter sp.]|uniref:c-type cytochrome n=1 Tax=uncultured Roseobacter sp. TaxID=114847 RepID=UPI0026142765|nr:c-type cytochrome [uncultured Roseobacter sp.]